MRVNRGLPPPAEDTRKPQLLVLVQGRDADGFWANLHELHDIPAAIKLAQQWTQETGTTTRVVTGVERKVVRTVSA